MCSMYLSGLKSSFFRTIEKKSILLMSKWPNQASYTNKTCILLTLLNFCNTHSNLYRSSILSTLLCFSPLCFTTFMLSTLMFHIQKRWTTQNLRKHCSSHAVSLILFKKNCPGLLVNSNTAPRQYYTKKFSNAVEDKINKLNQQGKQYYKMWCT
jgi:hypothetical protein